MKGPTADIRAVLFDFGGTLYDYATLAAGERESLAELAEWAGVNAEVGAIQAAHRDAMRRVFRQYLTRRFYMHRDLFRDAVVGMLNALGAHVDDEQLERYRERQWARHARDFKLRDGVSETLQALRARGLHLGVVSNIDDDQLVHLMALSDLEPYFDSILSSEHAGSCKPDSVIFAAALQRANCRADQTLFVGDTLGQDIAGANQAGMRSVLLWHRHDRDPPDGETGPDYIIRSIREVVDLVP